ncbi:MAG: hypothetical protein C4520_09460 [Candidatus Abyssobacteria bacterium SURF_5]|uniref:Uncharacterized protein n=1 Tax=Abyssobacteria bacterium (strain SURF_5) TaxID=2093360 RepID=A0A3A4NSY5_ABYX5|nr:MAG: hypothetical protein C4520_09460 [Candidatus Abyssubacteria bacterium SURF_5]
MLTGGEEKGEFDVIRRATHTGRPLGSDAFLANIEQVIGRLIRPKKAGRPRKSKKTERSKKRRGSSRK